MSSQLYHEFLTSNKTTTSTPGGHSDDNAKIVLVTPKQAQEWLRNAMFDRQRDMRPGIVKKFASLMKRGEWEPNGVLRFGVLDGEMRNIDGQHRLAALVESQTSQKFAVVIEHVSSDYDLGLRFASIDRGTGRTPSDIYTGLGIAQYYGWTKTELNMVTPAVRFVAAGFTPKGDAELSTHDVALLLDKYAASFDIYRQYSEKLAKYMIAPAKRRCTIGIALVTINESSRRYGADKVRDFWTGAFTRDGVNKYDPRSAAFEHLVGSSMWGGSHSKKGRDPMSPEKSARILAHCWNAFVDGRELKKKSWNIDNASAPIHIRGSLYDGKRTSVENPTFLQEVI